MKKLRIKKFITQSSLLLFICFVGCQKEEPIKIDDSSIVSFNSKTRATIPYSFEWENREYMPSPTS